MQTVTVTVNSIFQNATPFEGFIRVRLGTPLVEVDSTFIAQLNPQEIDFGGGNPEVSFLVIPNSLLGEDTYYVVEIYRTTLVGAHHEYDLLLTSNVVVPDHDCNLADITVLEPIAPEPVEVSKKYASEAKQSAIEAEAAKEAAKKAAAAAEYFADNAEEIKTRLDLNTRGIMSVGGITMGDRTVIYKDFITFAKTEPRYWTILNSAEWYYNGVLDWDNVQNINDALPTPVATPLVLRDYLMAGILDATPTLTADQITIISATWYNRGELLLEDLDQIKGVLDAMTPTETA